MAIASSLLSPIASLRRAVGSVAWDPSVSIARSYITSLFEKIEVGQLRIHDSNGSVTICGRQEAKDGEPRTELRIHNDTFWVRMLLFADMGFAESYMLAEVSCPNLTAFFELFIHNRSALSNGSTLTSSLSSSLTYLARSTNTLTNSRLNISAHYDISNAMFAAFLSEDMTYSCPIWLPTSHPDSASETLEKAQYTKLMRFVDNARIKSTDHVLEIGTGWGSFAILAVQKTGCRVTTVTLSSEQKTLAEERIAAAGLSSRISVHLADYRSLPLPPSSPNQPDLRGPYDKFISIEMLEAVGPEFLTTYFSCVNSLLKPNGGIAVFQCITMPETRYDAYVKSTDFIRRYIFPGGHLPAVSQLVGTLNEGSGGRLIVDDIENIGAHYAKTLRLWREKFGRSFEEKIRPALLREHEHMTKKDVELFRRKWEYYFTYCEAGFRTGTLGDVIITVAREGSLELGEDVPL